ncbi:tetratricopeptide repeat protein [Chitinophaga dinghuensis]|uniref:tetratricopeptide repeat protein n=1 Tax=Chitinophaga dinghuensis TaxID=1539050 RepID=UPI0014767405|nr:tetratricopeptide repeat protein [Chitinophaga dinghuensis]
MLLADSQYRTEDKNKLERYVKIYKSYGKLGEIDKAEIYVDRAIKLAEKLKLPSFIGRAYYSLGFYYQSHGHFIQAEDTYNKGIRKSLEIGDKQLYGDIYYNMGAMYASWSDFDKALSANLKAVAVYNELDNKLNAAGCYVNIADAYKSLEQYKTAITYLEQAVQVFKQFKGEEYGLALSYANMGANYFLADEKELGMSKTEKYQVALNFLDLSLGFANPLQDYSLFGTIYRTRAKILSVNGSSEQALDAFQKALASNKRLYNKRDYALDQLALADFYIEHAQYHEATPLLTEALSIGEENHLPALQRDANLALSKLAEKQQQFTKALEYFKAYIRFRDQIFNEEKEREITRKRLQLDFLVKENDYKSRQHVMSLALQKRTLEARERKQQLELKEKEMRIEKLALLQKQAILEKEKLQKESELERQRLNASLDRKYRDEKILKQETKARLNRNLAIFLGLLVLALSGAALLVYRAHRKTQQLNRLVLKQKTELEELGKVKDRILGVVSHDMRAPVNSLISFSKLLEHGNLSEERLRAYTLSLSQTLRHTSSMMENLLNWAYSQIQGFKPDLKMLEIGHLVQELVTAAEADASQKHLRISFSQDTEAKAFGDLNMVSLIVRNLLNNAVKFTPERGRIDVKIEHDFQLVRLCIADTGIGLGETQLQRFNSPKNIELGRSTAGTNSEKGIGLGLTLCKTFAAMMNAQLTASPNDEQGTIFILSMPSKAFAPKELKEFD